MTIRLVKFLRTIGVVAMVAGTIFELHGIYIKDLFDGADMAVIMGILAGASTFLMKGREKGQYVTDVQKYW